jgi:hypothetical protein
MSCRVGLRFYNVLRFQSVDGGGEGRPRDAQEDVHPPRQPVDGRAVDAEGRLLPQAQAHQQHLGQARLCEYLLRFSSCFFLLLFYFLSILGIKREMWVETRQLVENSDSKVGSGSLCGT